MTTSQEIMVNLCIGIASGAFSSIIISRIFLIKTTYSEQIFRVQQRFESSYSISGILWGYSKAFDSAINSDQIEKLNRLSIETIRNFTNSECKNFESMVFTDLESELHGIAIGLNTFVDNLSTLNSFNGNIAAKYSSALDNLISSFHKYKQTSNKIFIKLLIHDKCLRILAYILIIILLITIIIFL